jgi:hypothetical protein
MVFSMLSVPRGYQWDKFRVQLSNPVPGGITTGTGPPGYGNLESETVNIAGLGPEMTALARASSNCKRQTRPLVRQDVT